MRHLGNKRSFSVWGILYWHLHHWASNTGELHLPQKKADTCSTGNASSWFRLGPIPIFCLRSAPCLLPTRPGCVLPLSPLLSCLHPFSICFYLHCLLNHTVLSILIKDLPGLLNCIYILVRLLLFLLVLDSLRVGAVCSTPFFLKALLALVCNLVEGEAFL